MSNRSFRAQQLAIESVLEDMLIWYAENSGGKLPEERVEDKKTYRGIVRRWFEPLIPGVDNPCLVEEALGDSWTLRVDPIRPGIVTV